MGVWLILKHILITIALFDKIIKSEKVGRSVSFGGLLVDRPKIRVQSYRLKDTNPLSIREEVACVSGPNFKKSADGIDGLSTKNCDELVEFGSDFVKLGQDDGEQGEWSAPPNVTQLVLQCSSKIGPVEWDYQGRGKFPDIEIESRRITGDFWTATSYIHISEITFNKIDDQLTGTFICRNVEKASVSNHFYMFVPQEIHPILKGDEILKVTPSSHEDTIVIPCRLEDKESSVYLYKISKDGSLRRVNDVTFNPYLGFELENSLDVYGKYVCKRDRKNYSRRIKRESVIETSTSPGFSAFPTSEEISGLLTPEGYNYHEYKQNHPSFSADQVSLTYPSDRTEKGPRRRWKNNRRPPIVRRKVVNVLSKRGGPPHPYQYPRLRRPLRGHHSNLRPLYHDGHPMIAIPVSMSANHSAPDNYFYPANPHQRPPLNTRPTNLNVLPTFINKLGQKLRPPLKLKPFSGASSEEIDSKSTDKDGDVSASLEENTKNQTKTPPRKGTPSIQSLLPQTMTVMNSMGCVLKKVMLGPEASCNDSFFDAAALNRNKVFGNNGYLSTLGLADNGNSGPEEQLTILEVEVEPPPVNKFFPLDSTLYTTVPFFVKWQTRSTDFANWADVNHTLKEGTFKLHKAGHFEDYGVHSFEVFNLMDGESGRISVPFVDTENKVMHHTWEFYVINSTSFVDKGIKLREEGSKKIFTCKSATDKKPEITLTKLSDDGCPLAHEGEGRKRKHSKKKSSIEEDCGKGCASIRTDVEYGVVNCVGDGIDETIRFPPDLYCTGRPYFLERGKTKNLTLPENKKKLTIPCVINNPNADIFLFHKNENGSIEDVTDYATYDLKLGFSLNLEKIDKPLGTYACTSTTVLDDDSDMVTYHVKPASSYVFNPPSEKIFGHPPFRFVWESTEELEIENKSVGNFYSGVFAKPEGNRPFVGTFEITSLQKGGKGVVNVIRSKDKKLVHTWHYAYEGKHGLWVDRKLNIFKCKSTNSKGPSLFAVECSNPNVCKMKKRFVEESEPDRDNVGCGDGCTELKIWKNKPYGFVRCKDEGFEDTLNYFLSRNSTLLTENDNLQRFRSVEISSAVRKLRVGEMINLVCKANKYFYSKGFQWAVETKNGSKRFLDAQNPDEDSYLNEIKSQISIKIGDKDWKAVWCYAPQLDSNQWGNASQLIYIH